MRGTELLTELSDATGLPDDIIGEELSRLVATAGKTTDSVTLDDLREMLSIYLQDVLLEAKNSFNDEARTELESVAETIESSTVTKLRPVSKEVIADFSAFIPLGSSAPEFIGEG